MIEQFKMFEDNVVAIEVIDGFTEADKKHYQRIFNEKIKKGFSSINVLIKIDEMKVSKASTKVFFNDIIWGIKKYNNLGRLAIVANSNVLMAYVSINSLFFEIANEGREECYYDISQIENAKIFVNNNNNNIKKILN